MEKRQRRDPPSSWVPGGTGGTGGTGGPAPTAQPPRPWRPMPPLLPPLVPSLAPTPPMPPLLPPLVPPLAPTPSDPPLLPPLLAPFSSLPPTFPTAFLPPTPTLTPAQTRRLERLRSARSRLEARRDPKFPHAGLLREEGGALAVLERSLLNGAASWIR